MVDLIVYGATGFTGRQAAHYLAHACARHDLRLAIAGRRPSKLEALAAELPGQVDIIVADSARTETVDAMVRQGRVVVSTAGPFALYGSPVVEACVQHGVDYVDITGETPWVRDLIDRYHDEASARGVRIIPMCGFDSVPSDLGAFLLSEHIQTVLHERCTAIHASFRMQGGLNGGTLASLLNLLEGGDRDRLYDPFLLNPPGTRAPAEPPPPDLVKVTREDGLRGWRAPFAMAPINTRVVRRSQALRSADDPAPFAYSESMRMRHWLSAMGFHVGLAVFEQLSRWPSFRGLLKRFGPGPGEGPSEEAMQRGHTEVVFIGTTAGGKTVLARFEAPGDPGNRVTIRLLGEAALALRLQSEALPGSGGVLTPSTGLGMVLVERLRAAGMTLRVESEAPR